MDLRTRIILLHPFVQNFARRLLVTTLVCLALSYNATAATSDYTDNGWYTHDSSTGLYWLDLTETTHETWVDVYNQMGPGDRYEGWRFATTAELEYMWLNIGLYPQGNPCTYTGATFCDVYYDTTTMRVNANRIIDYFGNTFDPYFARSYDYNAPETPRGQNGFLEQDYQVPQDPPVLVPTSYLWELDTRRQIQSRGPREIAADHHYGHGMWLVRDTLPVPLSPLPDTTPPGAIDFDNVMPEDLGLQFACIGRYEGWLYSPDDYSGYCSGHLMMPENSEGKAEMRFGLASTFDRQATPYLRLKSFEFRVINPTHSQTVCDPDTYYDADLYIDDGTSRRDLEVHITDLVPAPQGNDWCTVTLDDDYTFLPPLGPDPDFPGMATILKIVAENFGRNSFVNIAFDNIVVELVGPNIVVDFDPWDASNEIRPDDDYFFTVAVMTTSVAAGDPYDFDASTVDAASLRLGPDGAQNIATPVVQDRDGDGDIDYTFAFEMQDSGLTCINNTVTLAGTDLSGNPIVGIDVVVPIDCDDIITVDVDPFNPANEIRPNDSYTVPVAILSTQVSNGDAEDIDATQVDPSTLRFGPAEAPNVNTPVITDLDGDSDSDVIFGFDAVSAGIACGDTELEVRGELYDTQPLLGMDNISTISCETNECHP